MAATNWKKLPAATDLGPEAQNAVTYAHDLAEQSGAELHVLYVAKDAKEMLSRHVIPGTVVQGWTEGESAQWLASLLGDSGDVRRVEVARIGEDPTNVILD